MEQGQEKTLASPLDAPGSPRERSPGGGRLRFVILAHPTVQVVRLATKLALAWFLVPEQFGEVTLAGLLIFLASHVAWFGLDEAVVYAPREGAGLWRSVERFHQASGAVMALVAAAAGLVVGSILGYPLLAGLALTLAPMVWLANLSVLPVALLVRHRDYRSAFVVDVSGVVGLAVVAVTLAALGAGPWSLVGGWYANAVLAVVVSRHLARPYRLCAGDGREGWREARRYGGHLMGASLLALVGERVSSFAVGLGPVAYGLGRAALGLYDLALTFSQASVQYATSLCERYLFPALAASHRALELRPAFVSALRFSVSYLMPGHVLLALLAGPLTAIALPAAWQGAAPILAWLALASGLRCSDLICSTALKAAGGSRAVLGLSVFKVVCLVVAVVATVPHGVVGVAVGVALARGVTFVASLTVTFRLLRVLWGEAVGELRRSLLALAVWCVGFVPAAWALSSGLGSRPAAHLVAGIAGGVILWAATRLALDREVFLREWGSLHRRISVSLSGSRS